MYSIKVGVPFMFNFFHSRGWVVCLLLAAFFTFRTVLCLVTVRVTLSPCDLRSADLDV